MKLNQVTAPAVDLDRSIAFYTTLGFKMIVKNDHYARFEIGDGASTFSLHLGEPAGNGPQLYFECDDLDARVAELKAKGVVFDGEPVDQSWLWREAWFSDPAGNRLCLYFAGENRRFPPWRLKERMMSGTSKTPLKTKLGIKDGLRVLAMGAPKGYAFATVANGPADVVHLFVTSLAELDRQLPKARKAMTTGGMLWVSWYKKAAKIPTDVTEDAIRERALATDLVDVKVCAVDDKWSGLKLVVRRELR
ncbi:MAG: VOC family protein [Alphaproteobacteria bacterium]|nr:VOC family protein [Alphaproteobacteria bacterium]